MSDIFLSPLDDLAAVLKIYYENETDPFLFDTSDYFIQMTLDELNLSAKVLDEFNIIYSALDDLSSKDSTSWSSIVKNTTLKFKLLNSLQRIVKNTKLNLHSHKVIEMLNSLHEKKK